MFRYVLIFTLFILVFIMIDVFSPKRGISLPSDVVLPPQLLKQSTSGTGNDPSVLSPSSPAPPSPATTTTGTTTIRSVPAVGREALVKPTTLPVPSFQDGDANSITTLSPATFQARNLRILCVGDSNTRQHINPHVKPMSMQWPTALWRRYGGSSKRKRERKISSIKNLGIPTKSACALLRTSMFMEYFGGGGNNNFDVAVVMLGTNDAREGDWKNRSYFKKCLTQVINLTISKLSCAGESAKNVEKLPRLLLLTPPPMRPGGIAYSRPPPYSLKLLEEEIRPAVLEVGAELTGTAARACSQIHIDVIDVFGKMVDFDVEGHGSKFVGRDGLHIVSEAGSLIADLVVDKLRK